MLNTDELVEMFVDGSELYADEYQALLHLELIEEKLPHTFQLSTKGREYLSGLRKGT